MSNDFSGLPGIGILASRLVGFDAELVAPTLMLVTSSVTSESVTQRTTRRMDMSASPPDESPVRAPEVPVPVLHSKCVAARCQLRIVRFSGCGVAGAARTHLRRHHV